MSKKDEGLQCQHPKVSIATIAEQETQKKQYIAKDVGKNLRKLNKWSRHNRKKQSNKF